jgi:hypothetical protein
MFQYLGNTEIAVFTEYQIQAFGPAGTFLFYASITFVGLFFYIFVLKESKGLTDKQKKELYCPKEPRDSK